MTPVGVSGDWFVRFGDCFERGDASGEESKDSTERSESNESGESFLVRDRSCLSCARSQRERYRPRRTHALSKRRCKILARIAVPSRMREYEGACGEKETFFVGVDWQLKDFGSSSTGEFSGLHSVASVDGSVLAVELGSRWEGIDLHGVPGLQTPSIVTEWEVVLRDVLSEELCVAGESWVSSL